MLMLCRQMRTVLVQRNLSDAYICYGSKKCHVMLNVQYVTSPVYTINKRPTTFYHDRHGKMNSEIKKDSILHDMCENCITLQVITTMNKHRHIIALVLSEDILTVERTLYRLC